MSDIPIKNSYIGIAVALYWAAGLWVGLSVSSMAIHTAIAVVGTVLLYVGLGGTLGGGVCKGLGVSYLWLGFSVEFLWYLCLFFFFLGAVALGVKLANPKAKGIPALPLMLVLMAVMFPQSDLGLKVMDAFSKPQEKMAQTLN